jgi:AraC-like DNA-binding protein
MSRVVEDRNRRMLRARDAMDRAFALPLDVPALARIAHVSSAHFSREFRETSARRRTATCSGAGSSVRWSSYAKPIVP